MEGKMTGTPSSEAVSTKLQRIAELARQAPQMALTTLSHHIDVEWLREAYRRTRKDGAAGVDGQTADDYAAIWRRNLRALLDRFKSGTLPRTAGAARAHPQGRRQRRRARSGYRRSRTRSSNARSRWCWRQCTSRTSLDCSYGFRPGRSAHHALRVAADGSDGHVAGWVLEVDIRTFLRHAGPRRNCGRSWSDGCGMECSCARSASG